MRPKPMIPTEPGMTQSIQKIKAYTSTKNELPDKKLAGDPQIPHYNNTYNNNSTKGDYET